MSKILVIDDEPFSRELICNCLANAGFATVEADNGVEGVKSFDDSIDVVLLDLVMPKMGGSECLSRIQKHHPHVPSIVVSAKQSAKDAAEMFRCGVFHYLTKPFSADELIRSIQDAISFSKKPKPKLNSIRRRPKTQLAIKSERSEILERQISKVAQCDASVLLTGETGTGKSVIARRIHEMSERSSEPFVAINCSAIPNDLFESELFGHAKGAFTGANSEKEGKISFADGGTLFLDELGDLPESVQPKLLTFLQDRVYYPVGSNKERFADVRIISATHQDLRGLIEEKKFRSDFYYRIGVLEILIPPLRERREDIVDLANSMLEKMGAKYDRKNLEFDDDATVKILGHCWPGNIRELENTIERATIFSESNHILGQDIEFQEQEVANADSDAFDALLTHFFSSGNTMEDLEKICIKIAIQFSGNKTNAAKLLGVSERTIFNKISKWNSIDEIKNPR
jgi:DNA-binding NtrC family response regulator